MIINEKEEIAKIIKAFPELRTKTKREAAFVEIIELLLDLGYEKEEIASINDARFIILALRLNEFLKAEKH